MLPSVLSSELRDAVAAFLRQAFPFASPYFQKAEDGDEWPTALIDGLIEGPGRLFKGPYLDIKLPFRFATSGELPFRHVELFYTPYQHQLRAFERLVGDQPKSTIIATGTGSGKTECFMLPVLDDCLHRRKQGIKTIIIYPMNALANDQAQRFAKEVAKLEPKLTVGLYVGDEPANAPTTMGPENVITSQETLRKNPPDVLLTNYKMLDFLLIRPKDQPLWRFNEPGMLRYLVVDELHTFDGAQGTDLGCLVRRLRNRLGAGDEVACVGTSATMGLESKARLVQYAADVFAADFDEAGIIEEDRLSAEEYLTTAIVGDKEEPPGELRFFGWPERDETRLDPRRYERAEEYLFHQARVWFSDLSADELPRLNALDSRRRAEAAVQLGGLLHQHSAFHELILASERVKSFPDLVSEWQTARNLPSRDQAERLLTSLISLVSAARRWNQKDSHDPADLTQPLLDVRQQVWLRELRRLVCSVPEDETPAHLAFSDDLKTAEQPLHLPLLHCRECHLGAWGAVAKSGTNIVNPDLQRFYEAWFNYSPSMRLIVPLVEGEEPDDYVQYFCPRCQKLQSGNGDGRCAECETDTLRRVWVPEMIKTVTRDGEERRQAHHDCPDCGAGESLAIVGYRAATLTSVMSARLFNSPYNDDWKLIAFSDSVQDAAHRAGFLEANTWRQVLRQAMAGWLRDQSAGINLEDMSKLLPRYWRDRNDDTHFSALFMPPNLAWHPHYRALNEAEADTLPPNSDLPDMVGRRLSWECLAEFGVRSRIGRSLERSGVAAVGFDVNRFNQDVAALAEQLREEIGTLRDIEDDRFRQFVIGWLHRMRTLGAIDHEALHGYLVHGGREYLINRISWMPSYGGSRRPPAGITLRHVHRNFEPLLLNRQDTWSVRWLKKTLGEDSVFAANEAQQIFKLMLDHLTRQHWLREHTPEGQRNHDKPVWMIRPERLLVDRDVETLRCNDCRHALPVSRAVVNQYEGLPCLRPSCHGKLIQGPSAASVAEYGATEPRRIVPHEHTGLLSRADRERVERSFIHGKQPWHVNLLSATPTLEMGIDIGALSSVFLCSVPPTQANYVQRVGRAGRRDGNALAVTIANGRNHDLYFYEEPLEMIAGSVHTPGVFLKAIAVLERQLIAYCFDRWAASGIDESAIPGQLSKALEAVEQQHLDCFPYNLIEFVRVNQSALLAGFIGMFEELQNDAQAQDYLHAFISESGHRSLSWRLLNRLEELVKERASLLKKIKDLKKSLEKLEAGPQDEATAEEIDQIRRERNALLSLVNGRNTQATLNFFTDEGLLPNYAFPEEGVTLQSVILRRLDPGERTADGKSYERTSYTLQRPATAALSELAPESRFYAVSHEMEIDQVDLDLSTVEEWRFCDRCHYSQRVDIKDQHSACPRCGSAQWQDGGQKQSVLRLRQVYSTVDTRANRIGDESEQRVPAFYNRQMLVDIEQDGARKGFRLKSDSLPFGFEFVDNVTLREVNFGPLGDESRVFSVAGKELARQGFKICKKCGKVQKTRRNRYRDEPHAYSCPLRAHPDQATDEDFHQSLYLYRELDSEAIRILLPLSEVAYSDERLHSFIAALNLGLRAYFRGDVDHLQVTEMREPGGGGSAERIYLVIYDRIPGGTGYLKELMTDPGKLFKVLKEAHERLSTCPCIDDAEKDGCYRCILAYRDSRNMPTISRHSAEQLLREILELRDQIETIESLGQINTNVLIESKLEQRFVDALGALPGAELGPKVINGKNGWLLTLPGADGRPTAWMVEHQIKVGPDQGVALNTAIDVLLTPARAEDAARYRPIAVYLDGLQYHHDKVDDDVCKRSALLLSKRYWVYSLNWDDLPEKGNSSKSHEFDLMAQTNASHQKMTEKFDEMAEQDGWHFSAEHSARDGRGGLDWLADLLRAPESAKRLFYERAVYRGWTALAPHQTRDAAIRENLSATVADLAPAAVVENLALDDQSRVPGGFAEGLGHATQGVELLVSLPLAAIESKSLPKTSEALAVHICFDDRDTEPTDEFKKAWRAFWHAANQLQFCPGFAIASRRAVSSGQLDKVRQTAKSIQSQAEQAEAALSESGPSWTEAETYSALPPAQLAALKALDLPAPEVGIDLVGEDGAVALGGELVELAWPDEKIAVVLEEPEYDLPGWRLVVAEDSVAEKLKQAVEQGVA